MTALQLPPAALSDVCTYARKALSGKRIALVGIGADLLPQITGIVTAADAFTRALSPLLVGPASDVLNPFELILLDLEGAEGTPWLDPDELAIVGERSIAVGELPVLLRLATGKSLAFREHWMRSGPLDELLLRCVLGLGADSRPRRRSMPAGSTVVLADDDTSVTAIVRRALERNGMTCHVAATGGDALALIIRLKPCAAILDVHMPGMDGFEVLSQMKRVAELAQTRVILLTGSEQEADLVRGFSLGADDYVCKPFNPMELTIRLMRVIGRV